MRRSLIDAKVLVTGGSSGIGRALCKKLVQRGAHVLATARREDRLQDLERECRQGPGSIQTLTGDLADPLHRHAVIDWIDGHWRKLDVLVNNAGAGAIGRFEQAGEERLRRIMEINFFAPAELTRECLPWLRAACASKRRPAILNIGSVLSHRAVPLKSEYCAAKFAMRGWSEALRVELVAERIDVLMLSPSTTKSEFFDSLLESTPGQKSPSVGSMSADQVAEEAIRVLIRSKRERILSWGGRMLVWLGRFFPRLTDWFLERFAIPKPNA
ncbi:Putative oxidoreductase SadH [Pirellula sp. SH-Sr6A]|uniref:SDR family NAD(P)-dependent oxidoreductase n=1 Tax=Pirellula sp. SH-Sr6A TaxID=1632865 RepID=UPI00078B6C4D|nr:SDR family NAD(P)-dependent oxidoreductase [Pirellula sp. SH-Sr6A]AMV35537.1 Putative oxidoreductase SadH [Pirellula sp. SH-Sr6A]